MKSLYAILFDRYYKNGPEFDRVINLPQDEFRALLGEVDPKCIRVSLNLEFGNVEVECLG